MCCPPLQLAFHTTQEGNRGLARRASVATAVTAEARTQRRQGRAHPAPEHRAKLGSADRFFLTEGVRIDKTILNITFNISFPSTHRGLP